jgi:hypothetical protein
MATSREYLESIVAIAGALLELTDEELDVVTGPKELATVDDTLDSILEFAKEQDE